VRSTDARIAKTRFYSPDAHAPGDLVPLPADEARHLLQVLRLGTGTAVRMFNGRGAEFDAVVEGIEGRHVSVRLIASRDATPEPRVAVTLAQSVLKGNKMDDLVRDAVMMGVVAVQPVVSGRTEVTVAALARSRRPERWARIAVASVKQCGRAFVPHIQPPISITALLDSLGSAESGPALMFVEPGASMHAVALTDADLPAPTAATLIIGPEGGWTPEELERASHVCHLLTLGRRTLRADAMPLVALAALFATWKEL
jgi:16S rRNA (uracil1498-N3)-methyltransferase